MGRPRGGTNRSHSKEEKLALVKRNLAGKTASALEKKRNLSHADPQVDQAVCREWRRSSR